MARDTTISKGWGDPAAEAAEHSWSWLHVPARTVLHVTILSREPTRYYGHWVEGRCRPCRGASCPYEDQHRGGNWRHVFSVWDSETRTTALLELGASAAETIYNHAHANGRLRGLRFSLRKEGQKARGRLIVEAEAATMAAELLPEPEDPEAHIQRGWQIDREGVERAARSKSKNGGPPEPRLALADADGQPVGRPVGAP